MTYEQAPDQEPENHSLEIDDRPTGTEERSPEDVAAEIRQSIREAGRRKGGVMGAAFAGAMIALQEIYEGPPKEELTIVAEADGDPHDLDTDGVRLSIDHNDISAPPIERDLPEE